MKKQKNIKGFLEAFFETGTEGIIWCIYETKSKTCPKQHGYEGLYVLKSGDKLTAWSKDKMVKYEGVIDLDFSVRVISPYWVHGSQKGLKPELWLEMFEQEYAAKVVVE